MCEQPRRSRDPAARGNPVHASVERLHDADPARVDVHRVARIDRDPGGTRLPEVVNGRPMGSAVITSFESSRQGERIDDVVVRGSHHNSEEVVLEPALMRQGPTRPVVSPDPERISAHEVHRRTDVEPSGPNRNGYLSQRPIRPPSTDRARPRPVAANAISAPSGAIALTSTRPKPRSLRAHVEPSSWLTSSDPSRFEPPCAGEHIPAARIDRQAHDIDAGLQHRRPMPTSVRGLANALEVPDVPGVRVIRIDRDGRLVIERRHRRSGRRPPPIGGLARPVFAPGQDVPPPIRDRDHEVDADAVGLVAAVVIQDQAPGASRVDRTEHVAAIGQEEPGVDEWVDREALRPEGAGVCRRAAHVHPAVRGSPEARVVGRGACGRIHDRRIDRVERQRAEIAVGGRAPVELQRLRPRGPAIGASEQAAERRRERDVTGWRARDGADRAPVGAGGVNSAAGCRPRAPTTPDERHQHDESNHRTEPGSGRRPHLPPPEHGHSAPPRTGASTPLVRRLRALGRCIERAGRPHAVAVHVGRVGPVDRAGTGRRVHRRPERRARVGSAGLVSALGVVDRCARARRSPPRSASQR